jgi:flagellar basal body-associated protein FliL
MVRKAKLDILDVPIDVDMEAPPEADGPSEEGQEGLPDGQKTAVPLWERLKGLIRRFLVWIIAAVFFIAAAAGLTIWIFYEPAAPVPAKKPGEATAAPAMTKTGNIAFFSGFVIDLKDEKSNTRIVLCDVALELSGPRDIGAIEGRIDARNAIYGLLKNKRPQELLISAGRDRLKEDLKKELNRFFGEDLVKDVYFSRVEAI